MKVPNRSVVVAIAVALIAGGIFVFDHLQHGGWFKRIQPHFAGTCTTMSLGGTAEDIAIDAARGLAFLTYRRKNRGTVMLMDLGAREPRARSALATEPPRFMPRSVSLYAPGAQPRRLFALSAPGGDERSVEIFEETATGAFAPLETIRDPLLAHANSIVAVGPREFYVAHDSGASDAFERFQERVFRRGLSTVTYFDGERLQVLVRGLKRAHGIDVSNHGLWVYVGEADAERLRIFDRDSTSGALAPRNVVPLGSAPEDVTVDADGTVWIAAHPQLLALRAHLRDPRKPSPTAVYRLRTAVVEKDDRLTIPFLDSGERISAGSVAAVHEGRMLIGSLTERRVLLCDLPDRL